MKKSGLFIILVIFIIGSSPIHADSVIIEYLEGSLEILIGHEWTWLDIGDEVDGSGKSLKLSDYGYAELGSDTGNLTLTKDGVYQLEPLMKKLGQSSGFGLGQQISQKVYRLQHEDEFHATAVMGVRGAAADTDEMIWADEDGDPLATGLELFENGDYAEALDVFLDGLDYAFAGEEEELTYYAALCEEQLGSFRSCRNLLMSLDPSSSVPWYGDFVLLKGRYLSDSLEYTEALTLIDSYLRNPGYQETIQAVLVLQGYCFNGLDNQSEAVKSLNKAVSMDAGSDWGRTASNMLKNM